MTDTQAQTPKRLLQLAEDIREFIARMFAHGEVRDPRVQGITIHHVKLTPDLRIAKVYYITPLNSKRKEVEKVLKKSVSAYVRKSLGKQLLIRHIPEIHFYYDDYIDHAIKINELLSKIDKND